MVLKYWFDDGRGIGPVKWFVSADNAVAAMHSIVVRQWWLSSLVVMELSVGHSPWTFPP